MSDENTTITAPAATDARNCMMNLIAGQMVSVKAMREDRTKWLGEATDLITPHAVGAVQRHPADQLISREVAAREAK